jgi:Tfp pilus assembly protein PilW
MSVALVSIAIAATSGMFLASKQHMTRQQRQLETTEVARATADMMVRDLRLGGACMPVTGDFISLEGINNGTKDEVITRTGLTRPDLTCVSTVVPNGQSVAANGAVVPVQSTDGFKVGMRVYIRNPVGEGEYFEVTAVNSPTQLGKTQTLTQDYPATSGIYTVDERRFFLYTWTDPDGAEYSELRIQVGAKAPQSFAAGIEKLDVRYQLQRNCPPCDVVNMPSSNDEWAMVDSVVLGVTARSLLPDEQGQFYRRTVSVNVKPRNLLPR